jgi:AraC family transcriptional regulator, ethanolamine operon transcriptional activator
LSTDKQQPRSVSDFYRPIACTDASELNAQVREWNGDFAQLSAGSFHANGGLTQLGAVSVVRLNFDQTILNRSYAPANAVAFLFPGQGSGASFVRGREIDSSQCVAIANDACCEAITKGHFVVMAAAIDLDFWNAQSHWLRTDSVAGIRSARIISRAAWRNSVESSINWIFRALAAHPEAFNREDVRASLSDRFLVTLANLSPPKNVDVESTRDASVRRRKAVERARAYIHENLSEPIRLSDLCLHSHVQSRALEYGFREVSGLSPVTYIKALRLSKVRKALMSFQSSARSISEIACDHGFWHLSQFSMDYRKFFGESPSVTRMRVHPKSSITHATEARVVCS